MSDPLIIKRKNGAQLSVVKQNGHYNIALKASGHDGGKIKPDELAQIEAYIGDDPDGQQALEKLRRKVNG